MPKKKKKSTRVKRSQTCIRVDQINMEQFRWNSSLNRLILTGSTFPRWLREQPVPRGRKRGFSFLPTSLLLLPPPSPPRSVWPFHEQSGSGMKFNMNREGAWRRQRLDSVHPSPPCASPVLFRLPLLDPLVRLSDTALAPAGQRNCIWLGMRVAVRTETRWLNDWDEVRRRRRRAAGGWLATRETRTRKEGNTDRPFKPSQSPALRI